MHRPRDGMGMMTLLVMNLTENQTFSNQTTSMQMLSPSVLVAATGLFLARKDISMNDLSQYKPLAQLNGWRDPTHEFEYLYVIRQVSKELCEKVLTDAKTQLHPLLRQADLEKLGQRTEFILVFKNALEKELAQKIVLWLPSVKIVYKFDALHRSNTDDWDNTIHLLLLVPRLLPAISELGITLDNEILKQLKHFRWSRFQDSKSMIEVQQVTPNEIRHGVCYGAMFFSLYAAPSQVWPLK